MLTTNFPAENATTNSEEGPAAKVPAVKLCGCNVFSLIFVCVLTTNLAAEAAKISTSAITSQQTFRSYVQNDDWLSYPTNDDEKVG